MDNYEVNVLTRKGGWKKLPQEVVSTKEELSLNKSDNYQETHLSNSDNLNINVTEDTLENHSTEDFKNNLFENFTEINNIIKKLKTVENEKSILINELNDLMKDFEIRRNRLDQKLLNIQKEQEMYDKAINLISSLKNV